MTPKEDKELKEAKAQLEQYISGASAPKGLGQGLTVGVSNIIAGALGGAGVAVIAPVLGLALGLRTGGIIGGALGLGGGAVAGGVGAIAFIVTGAVSGVTQIVRGIVAVPESVIAPHQGEWWNSNEGQWVLTKMDVEIKEMEKFPADDSDLIGDVEQDLGASTQSGSESAKDGSAVVDMFYYETLDVPPDADDSTIRRRYYLLAKKYHPDRNLGDAIAADKFKDVAEAYQVLGDKALRKRYDTVGRDGLSADKMSVNNDGKIDPAILFAFLFGSDKFMNYVGRMATATSALVGNPPKVAIKDARTLQKRRCIRLAAILIDKVTPWVSDHAETGDTLSIEAEWTVEATDLATASYGYQLVTTIGKLYNLLAIQYQGNINSGQGLPSVSRWAQRQKARMEAKSNASKNQIETLKAGLDMMKLQQEMAIKLSKAETDEEKEKVIQELEEHSVGVMLRVLWTITVVDITSTIYEVVHHVLYDQSVDKKTRWNRSNAIKMLGDIWMNQPEPQEKNDEEKDAKKLYEEAAFAAMLETVKRKDESNDE